ncbi:MAG: hypothetical protein AAFO82_16485 [Bacteroidota bacterium]
MSHSSKWKKTLIQKIAKGEIEQVIQLLISSTEELEESKELLLYSARFSWVQQSMREGILNLEKFNLEFNSLTRNLIEFVQKLETSPTSQQSNVTAYKKEVKSSFIRVKVNQLLLDYYEKDQAVSITDICTLTTAKNRGIVVHILNEMLQHDLLLKSKENNKTLWKLSKRGKTFLNSILNKK